MGSILLTCLFESLAGTTECDSTSALLLTGTLTSMTLEWTTMSAGELKEWEEKGEREREGRRKRGQIGVWRKSKNIPFLCTGCYKPEDESFHFHLHWTTHYTGGGSRRKKERRKRREEEEERV